MLTSVLKSFRPLRTCPECHCPPSFKTVLLYKCTSNNSSQRIYCKILWIMCRICLKTAQLKNFVCCSQFIFSKLAISLFEPSLLIWYFLAISVVNVDCGVKNMLSFDFVRRTHGYRIICLCSQILCL